jgi:transcription initiation factor TFIID TATA-box-binding protein
MKVYIPSQIGGCCMVKIKVENIVATAVIGTELDLQKVGKVLENAEFSPERFPGLICHTKKPKSAVLIFRSGKLVCTGTRSMKDVHKVIRDITKKIAKFDKNVIKNPEIQVQNIVASTDLENELDLTKIAITFGLEKIEYEPEQFPGLVYRVKDPKVVSLLFSSGKIVCTGATKIEDIYIAVEKMKNELSSAGFLP